MDPHRRTAMPPRIRRRSFLAGTLGLAASASIGGVATAQQRRGSTPAPLGLSVKGVNYDTDRDPAELWVPEYLAQEMQAIADDLHCNSVLVLGHEQDRLLLAAERAAENGLAVWLEPRQFDSNAADTIAFVVGVAEAAEALRAEHPDVGLSLGVELSIFMDGIVPGDSWDERGAALATVDLAEVDRHLNEVLGEGLSEVRRVFGGQVTYSSGPWEGVDWTDFDMVGVDMYRDETNEARFVEEVRALRRHGKPVLITEFGCGCFGGADDLGGLGFTMIDYSKDPPELADGVVRDERVQADYIDELLTIFDDAGMHGAFVYDFIQPSSPHIPEAPQYDYDTISFSVVKCYADDDPRAYRTTGTFEPKVAFHTIAERFR